MVKKISFILIISSFIFCHSLRAQTVPSPLETTINVEPQNLIDIPDEVMDTLTDPMTLLSSTDSVMLSLSVLLADTNTISKVHVKLGNLPSIGNLLTKTYNYDDLNPGEDLTYFRDGDLMMLGMGSYLNINIFYCEIVIEDAVGNLSSVINVESGQ